VKRLAPLLDIDPTDLTAVLGLAILACGVALVSVPAALIVVGALILLYAVLASRTPAEIKS
jgi:hypothetical protein